MQRRNRKAEIISLDTETTGFDSWHGCRPFLVTTARHIPNKVPEIVWWEWEVDPFTRRPIVPKKHILEIKKIVKNRTVVMQNSKFDVRMLETLPGFGKWDWSNTHDLYMSSHLINSGEQKDLSYLSLKYLRVDLDPHEKEMEKTIRACINIIRREHPDWRLAQKGDPEMPSARGSLWKSDLWTARALLKEGADIPEEWAELVVDYANYDSESTLLIFLRQMEVIKKKRLDKIYEHRRSLMPVVYDTETHGVTYSKRRNREHIKTYKEESIVAGKICVGIANSMGHDLTLPKSGNNKSLMTFVYGGDCETCESSGMIGCRSCPDCKGKGTIGFLNLTPVKFTDKGNPSLDGKAMETYATMLDPRSKAGSFLNNLGKKRKRDTARTYLDGYERFGVSHNGKTTKDWATLHPSLNPADTYTLRFSSKNPNGQNVCFDEETEVLTEDGWMTVEKLMGKNLKIAEYDPENKSVRFVHHRTVKQKFSGQMCHIKTHQQIDMMLTPNHRCLLRDRKRGKHKVVKANDFRNDWQHLHAGFYCEGTKQLSKEEVILICAVQADGSYVKSGGYECGITFLFKKKRKYNRLIKCLNKLGANFSTGYNKGILRIYIKTSDRYNKFVRELMPEKTFGSWLLNYDQETLRAIFEEVFLWDGEHTRKTLYTSSKKENVDWVQTVAALTGSRAWQYSKTPNNTWNTGEHHYLNVTWDKDSSSTTNHSTEGVEWDDDYVYCVTVPSSFVLIRRNGKISVTGNSKKEGFNLRYVFGPVPGREWWSIDYNNLEYRLTAYESGEQAMIDLFEMPDESPLFGSQHLLNASIIYPDMWAKCEDGNEFKERYPMWYRYAKEFGFAVNFGAQLESGTADAAARRLGSHEKVLDKFPKNAALNKRWIRFAKKHGYVETLPDKTVDPHQGYPIYCPLDKYGRIPETKPFSNHIQSTAGWVICSAMLKVKGYLCSLPGYLMVLQIHDELLFDFPYKKNQGNLPVIKEIRRLMESCGDDIEIPLTCDATYHPNNWSEGE